MKHCTTFVLSVSAIKIFVRVFGLIILNFNDVTFIDPRENKLAIIPKKLRVIVCATIMGIFDRSVRRSRTISRQKGAKTKPNSFITVHFVDRTMRNFLFRRDVVTAHRNIPGKLLAHSNFTYRSLSRISAETTRSLSILEITKIAKIRRTVISASLRTRWTSN